MLKKNKLKIIISSVMILLPIIFGVVMWNSLPDSMTTHWGADGNADVAGSKAFAVFGLPVILLLLHLVCILFTSLDKKQEDQSPKALGMIFWIIPVISILVNGIMYRAAFGLDFDMAVFMPIFIGAMFIFMGNYLPKVKSNRTLGVRISWTLNNEENWNLTHRFTGKLWVVGGVIVLPSVLLPTSAMVAALLTVTLIMAILPMVYSYRIYKRHQKEGIVYTSAQGSKAEKNAVKISAVIIAVILIGVIFLMFTGNITAVADSDSLKITATYWTDIDTEYSEIDSVSYRDELDVGVRTNGFGSPRLSLGIFENDEFGQYTLYAYTGAEEYIVLTSNGKTLVIGLKNTSDTRALYESISEKLEK